MATASSNLSSYDSGYSAYSVSNLNNGCAGDTSTSYAQINLTRQANAVTEIYYNFGTLSIPTGATSISVSCSCKCSINTTSASRVSTRQAQLYRGTTAMGTASNVANSTTAFSISAGTWTAAQLNGGVKLRLYAVRGTSNVSNNYYFRLYGATLTVTYTEPVTGNKIFIKSNGSWVQASKVYVKVSGSWQEVNKVYKKVSGSWVEQSDKSALFDPNAVYKKG